MMKLLAMILLSVSACTTPGKVGEVDTKDFESKGGAQDGQVGLNGKGQAVIRDNKAAADELAILDLSNTHLRDEVERNLADLKECENELNDPRLGGTGRVTQMPDVEKLKSIPEVREELGLDEDGDLRVVQEQSFTDRLKAERRYSETLKRMGKVARDQNEECQHRLVIVREQHGIRGQKYGSDGYFAPDGTWVENKHGERSLDDAFEENARAKGNAH